MALSIDFETRSVLDLRKTGVYPYAAHPHTDVWCMAYALGDEPIQVWVPGQSVPKIIRDQRQHPNYEFRAWNAQFERIIWREIMVKRYGFPEIALEQWVDTAVEAAALALPRGLEDAARVLGLDVQKDMEGRNLMLRMAKPRKKRKGERGAGPFWWDDEERRARLYEYCRTDVEVERAIAARLRPLSARELDLYHLDQRINDRGVRLDRPLIEAAQAIVAEATERGSQELAEITGGAVSAVSRIADLKRWLGHQGLDVDSLAKAQIRDLLETDLDPDVQRALEIRSDVGKSSTSKLTTMQSWMGDDDRARGLLLFHGAGTGRWAGKGIQTQNFPRGTVKGVEGFIDRVMAQDLDAIEAEAPAVAVVSSMLRSMIVPSPGSRFLCVDYSQIEARVVAWLAGQWDLVDLFASGGKVYEDMASFIYGIPVEEISKDSYERQIGKNSVLGAGFQMGADRFAGQVWEQTGIILERGLRYACGSCRVRFRAPAFEDPEVVPCPRCSAPLATVTVAEDEAARAITGYRTRFPKIPELWRTLNAAAFSAVQNPGETYRVKPGGGEVVYTRRGQFLWCRLPSGRFLAYPLPKIRQVPVPWDETGEQKRPAVTYATVDARTRRWTRRPGYGGLWTENVVQAVARDLLAEAIVRAEAAGYPVVLHTHDELLADTPEGHGSLADLERIMQIRSPWAKQIPVATEGWEGERYRK